MILTRRDVLHATAGAVALSRLGFAEARGLLIESLLQDVTSATLDAAKKAGASYADVRIHRRREESVTVRDDHVEGVGDHETYGIGVRVLVDGAWGFAASPHVDVKSAQKVAAVACDIAKANAKILTTRVELAPNPAHVDVWQTPLEKDPFKIPVADKAALLLDVTGELLKVPGVKYANASLQAMLEWKLFASSEGALLEQSITRLGPGYSATAIDEKSGEFVSRQWDGQSRQAGFEYLETSGFRAAARKVGEDTVEKLKAPSVEPAKKTLILDPTNLWLTVHESVGHPTELDRAMGYEANFAGTSFATPDKLGKLKYGSDLVTIYADKTTPGGLATVGYDDEGVRTQKWNLIEKGLFVGYQTTRDQAAWIHEKASRGCSYAQDHRSVQFQRMPNVSLAPSATKDLKVKDLISATDDGIYIVGTGSWSIDHQRYNFQFTGQMFYEVKKGRITHALKDVGYQSSSPEFWSSLDLLGGPSEWMMGGALDDGKGEPEQSNAVSHGCPPARFKGVNILNTRAGKKA